MTKEQAMEEQRMTLMNIRWMLKKQGKRFSDLEKYCGVSNGYISRCEGHSKRRLSLVIVMMAADYLGMTIEELMSADLAREAELNDIDAKIMALQKRKSDLIKEEDE